MTLRLTLPVRPIADRIVSRALAYRQAKADALTLTLPIHSAFWRARQHVEGELLYVVIGDSAAQGIGASGPERGYVSIIADRYRDLTGRSVRVVNLSVSGARLREAIADQLPRLAGLDPDLLTVSIGANDIAEFDEKRFALEIDGLYSQLPSSALVADLPCFYLPASERKVAVANRLLRAASARYGLTTVPLHAITKRQGIVGALFRSAADLFHPNDRGYRLWASAFLPKLRSRIPVRA